MWPMAGVAHCGAMFAISTQHLQKSYGDHTVLNDVTLDVRVGEVFALLGPNGAGKTTTVEILEGHRRAGAGLVEVLGVDPATGDGRFRRRLGIVPQETAAFERATVAETLAMFAALYDDPLDIDEALATVDLDVRKDQLVDTLSGGQRRRLDVGCGLVGRPELLFLDEPSTGLDPEARRALWSTIAAQRDSGVTVLLTTHALDEAEFLADRIGVLLGGQLAAVSETASLGDRNHAPSTVRYRTLDGESVSLVTHTPAALVSDLFEEFDGEPPDLSVTKPSLEDVYLSMVRAHAATATPPSTAPSISLQTAPEVGS